MLYYYNLLIHMDYQKDTFIFIQINTIPGSISYLKSLTKLVNILKPFKSSLFYNNKFNSHLVLSTISEYTHSIIKNHLIKNNIGLIFCFIEFYIRDISRCLHETNINDLINWDYFNEGLPPIPYNIQLFKQKRKFKIS